MADPTSPSRAHRARAHPGDDPSFADPPLYESMGKGMKISSTTVPSNALPEMQYPANIGRSATAPGLALPPLQGKPRASHPTVQQTPSKADTKDRVKKLELDLRHAEGVRANDRDLMRSQEETDTYLQDVFQRQAKSIKASKKLKKNVMVAVQRGEMSFEEASKRLCRDDDSDNGDDKEDLRGDEYADADGDAGVHAEPLEDVEMA